MLPASVGARRPIRFLYDLAHQRESARLIAARRSGMLGNVPYDLGPVEHRVLGALIEKDLATPEYYPLSLNALTNACNQKTNRDPVMACDEASVRSALESLREGGLAVFVSEAGSRVLKFRHRLSDALNLSSGELAAIAVLLLRGPQTTGELRGRTSNLHSFADIEAVQHVLNKLASREPEPLAAQMSRLPGTKEPRWCHLFAPVPETQGAVPVSIAAAAGPGLRDRVEQLESEAKALREQLETMRKDLDELRSALL